MLLYQQPPHPQIKLVLHEWSFWSIASIADWVCSTKKAATEPMGRQPNTRGNKIAVAASAEQAANQAVKASRQGIAWQLKKAATVVPQPPE